MDVMRAVVAERPGPLADVLAVRDLELTRDLAPGEVWVRMLAAAVNPSDEVTVAGAYASRTSFPLVPGFEGVGVVARTGPGVPPSVIGRRVLPIGSAGCWAAYKRVELAWCVPVPDAVPDEAACFAYVNPLTAWLMVRQFCSSEVRRVAITAATSTIAGHLAQLLNEEGVRPIGLVRGTPGREVAEAPRWAAVVDTSDPAWPERLRHASGGPLEVVLDCVGGAQGATVMDQLRPGGTLVHYGLLSGQPLPATCFRRRDGGRVAMFHLRDTVHSCPRHELPALFEPVFDRIRRGRLRTVPARRVALSALPTLLRDQTGSPGKILVECQE